MNLWKITPQEVCIGLAFVIQVWEYLVTGGDSLNPKTTTLYRLSGTEGGGLGGAKGGAAVECAALCETAVAMLLEALTLSVDITLSGS